MFTKYSKPTRLLAIFPDLPDYSKVIFVNPSNEMLKALATGAARVVHNQIRVPDSIGVIQSETWEIIDHG